LVQEYEKGLAGDGPRCIKATLERSECRRQLEKRNPAAEERITQYRKFRKRREEKSLLEPRTGGTRTK